MRAILDSLGWPQPADEESLSAAQQLRSALYEERPDTLLAASLGLDGAVNLGDQLDRLGSLTPAPRTPALLALHQQVMLTLGKRRGMIRERVERRYAQAYEGLRPVPDADGILALLEEQGALQDRSPATLATCAQKIGARYRFLFASTLGVVRKEVYWLRDDLLRTLQRLGPEARELLALDRVLEAALEQATVRAHRGLEAGVAERFASQIIEALLQLPEDNPKAAVESWFRRRGFIARFMHDCRRLTWAVLDHEWTRLRALLDACCGPINEAERARSEALAAESLAAQTAPTPSQEAP